ncbi:MAG: Diguanylate cyclase protein [Actinomycetia bacterium]|nr:Diguanylate cyclase protein [Actinomycetes bacterium]
MGGASTVRASVQAALDYLPKGQLLPENVWRVRHRVLNLLLRAHVVAIFTFALLRGNSILHSAGEAGIIATFALLASIDGPHRRLSSSITALGLVACSAVLVHLSGGVIEMHFHFFVIVGIMTLYQDWIPFLVAIGFVVLHHAVLGVLDPKAVYNHQDAIDHPLRWAFIHGGFVLAASVASVVAWRLNEEQALLDSLTRLPNRRLFQDRVEHALARAQRDPGRLAVLFVDLDGFKDVNDSLGHAAGDQLLVEVARRLQAGLRPADTPARLGGDEFAVLLEDLASVEEAATIADRLVQAIAAPVPLRGRELSIGASVGVAIHVTGISVEDLLRNADVAMYTAKASGRGRVEVYEHAMGAAVLARIDIERELQQAVALEQFEVHYQPLVSLHDGEIVGVEALVRWRHPERGLLVPSAFLDVAENSGVIGPIGSWVLREATAQAERWQDLAPAGSLGVAVNLSPSQLGDDDVLAEVTAALAASGLSPALLTLELTEGVMLSGGPEAIERLHRLKALGLSLAIDDFGTGYSSLSYLRNLPVDVLKIDKLFVDGIAERETDAAFAAAILRMAQTLGLDTIAEGVETPEQATALVHLGCGAAQGFHFSRPVPADELEALLVDRLPTAT